MWGSRCRGARKVLRRRGNWRSLCPRRGGGCFRRRRAGGNHGSARSAIVFCGARLLDLRWTSQNPKGKEGAKDDCCREDEFFHSAVEICRKTQKHRLGNVTISTHWGVCLGGRGFFRQNLQNLQNWGIFRQDDRIFRRDRMGRWEGWRAAAVRSLRRERAFLTCSGVSMTAGGAGRLSTLVARPSTHFSKIMDSKIIGGGSRNANVLVGFSASGPHCSGVSMTAGVLAGSRRWSLDPRLFCRLILAKSWTAKSLGGGMKDEG